MLPAPAPELNGPPQSRATRQSFPSAILCSRAAHRPWGRGGSEGWCAQFSRLWPLSRACRVVIFPSCPPTPSISIVRGCCLCPPRDAFGRSFILRDRLSLFSVQSYLIRSIPRSRYHSVCDSVFTFVVRHSNYPLFPAGLPTHPPPYTLSRIRMPFCGLDSLAQSVSAGSPRAGVGERGSPADTHSVSWRQTVKGFRCAPGDKGEGRHIWELLTEVGRGCAKEVRSPLHLKPEARLFTQPWEALHEFSSCSGQSLFLQLQLSPVAALVSCCILTHGPLHSPWVFACTVP